MYDVRRTVYATVSEADHARVTALALRDRLTIAEWIRRCLNAYLSAHGQAPLTMRGRPQ